MKQNTKKFLLARLVAASVVSLQAFWLIMLAAAPAQAATAGCYQNDNGKITKVECPNEFIAEVDNGSCFVQRVANGATPFNKVSCGSIQQPSAPTSAPDKSCNAGRQTVLGIPTWYKYLRGTLDEDGKCSFNLKASKDFLPIGIAVLDIMIRLAGLVAVVFIVIGGIKYISSQGEPESAKNAKSTIINSLIGLVLVLISVGIVSFVGNRFGG